MTTEKRFKTTIIVAYSRSNTTRKVSFDTFAEAAEVVHEQRQRHPRSRKFNSYVFDSVEKKSILV